MSILVPPFARGWSLTNPPFGIPFRLNQNSFLARNLVAWWPPAGPGVGSLKLHDLSLYSNVPGVLTGNTTYTIDPDIGHVLTLDGTLDRVDGGNPTWLQNLPATTFSAVAWFRPSAVDVSNDVKKIIIAKADEFDFKWILGIRGNGSSTEWYATIDNNAISIGGQAIAGNLYNVTLTYNHGGDKICHIYINGVEIAYSSQSAHTGAYSGDTAINVWIGAFSNGEGAVIGRIGDVRLYNRILSPGEVQYIYLPQTRWELYQPLSPIFLTSSGLNLEQEGFRFRADDGDEDAATWLAAQDISITRATLTNTRLRVIVNATGDPGSNQYQLEYRKVGDTDWKKVNP